MFPISYSLQSNIFQRVIYTLFHFFTFINSFFLRSLLNSLQYDFCYPHVNETTLVKANDCDYVTNTMVISLSSSIQLSVISQNFFHLNEISSGFLSTLLTTTSQSPFLTPPSLLNFSLIVGEPQDSVQDPFLPTLSL